MESSDFSFLIGVDGGGTACRVALVAGARRFDARLGPANVATDKAGAIAVVRDGIAQVLAQARMTRADGDRARVHVALAGIKSLADERAVAAGIGMAHVTASEDQLSSLCGALGARDGFVVAVGTGSFLARQQDGQHRFIGGWGIDLGDEASGAWLGRGILAAALRARDGVSKGSALCDEVMGRFGDAAGVLAFAAKASPAEIAGLAPEVVKRAGEGDEVARDLMQAGAVYIEQGLAALGYQRGAVVSFTGGLRQAYQSWLSAGLRDDLRERLGDPLEGALFLAGKMEADA